VALDARLSIETPESVTFHYEVADVGARALALAIDLLIQYVVLGLVFIGSMRLVERVLDVRATVWLLVAFAVNWFYFVAFELAWSGQTPGKRAVGIRVVRSGGYPVTWSAVLTRNLLRVVDALPLPYGVALVVAFCEPQRRRVGDLLAGTLVVRERGVPDVWSSRAAVADRSATTEWDAALAIRLDEATRELVIDYLARREELEPRARVRVRAEIVDTVLDRLPSPAQRGELIGRLGAARQDDFLEAVAAS
jgi:uncharacterized RDD family membrane protein YckC